MDGSNHRIKLVGNGRYYCQRQPQASLASWPFLRQVNFFHLLLSKRTCLVKNRTTMLKWSLNRIYGMTYGRTVTNI